MLDFSELVSKEFPDMYFDYDVIYIVSSRVFPWPTPIVRPSSGIAKDCLLMLPPPFQPWEKINDGFLVLISDPDVDSGLRTYLYPMDCLKRYGDIELSIEEEISCHPFRRIASNHINGLVNNEFIDRYTTRENTNVKLSTQWRTIEDIDAQYCRIYRDTTDESGE